MVGLPGDSPLRTDANGYRVNRMFSDVEQGEPEVHADVTWNPSVCYVVHESLFCPTSEEFILPIEHGNDRCKWFC